MLADAGNISCAFNSTVSETVQHIPEKLKWAQKNFDIVQVMVFIIYLLVTIYSVDWTNEK